MFWTKEYVCNIYSFVVYKLFTKEVVAYPIPLLERAKNEECYYPSLGLFHSKHVDGMTKDGKNQELLTREGASN